MHIDIKKLGKFIGVSLFLCSILSLADAPSHDYLEQNWTQQERDFFYFTDQGSRLLPYDFFLNLEQEKSQNLFRDDENLRRFGLIPAKKSGLNPDGLPVGLARNKDYMGPTCAACHTQQINYQNKMMMIDGAQSFFDLQKFLAELTSSMQITLKDPEKFTRFASRMLSNNASKAHINELKQSLTSAYEKREAYALENHTDVPYGYARLDAFGAILNRGLALTGEKNNTNPPNAPTSVPYIWDTPQHDYVEWNGSQSNSNIGAFARNIGEVMGVFGEVETKKTNWLGLIDGGYASSIQTSNLRKFEKLAAKLQSPVWPENLPKIDAVLAKQGRVLYEKNCIACHVDINRTDPKRMIKVRMSTLDEVRTDPMMAQNAIFYKGKSGKFEGLPRYYVAGGALPKVAPALDITNHLMVGVIKNNPLQAYLAQKDANAFGHGDEIHPPKYVNGKVIEAGQEVSEKALLAYKARPLNGVWSSAPFLHNGSVPNMYQLLLPAKDRIKQFYIGSMEFDPKHVGFEMPKIKEAFLFDTSLAGNSNTGHEYGAGYGGLTPLTEDERWQLIEYIKTL